MLLLDASQFDFSWQNLHLKPMTERDLQLYVDLYTNPRTMQFIQPPLTLEKATESFYRVLKLYSTPLSKRLYLTITPDFLNDAVGIVCISHLDREQLTAELGCMLLQKGHGRDVGKQAVLALMSRIAEKLNINAFEMSVQPGNLAALRAVRLLSFKPSATDANLYQLNYNVVAMAES